MIKKYSLVLIAFLCFFVSGFSQPWTENFNTQSNNSYAGTSIVINGRTWTKQAAGNFSYANTNMFSPAFTINDDNAGAHITTPVLNTCGTISFDYAYINGNATNVFQLQTSTDGTNFTTVATRVLGAAANLSYVNYSYNVNSSNATTYVRILSDNQNAHLFIDNLSVTVFAASTPTITATPTNITGLGYSFGSPTSASQSFDVTGNLLVNGTTVTSNSTNFEVSLDDTSFTNSVNIPAGTLNGTTTIYTRLATGLATNTYNSTLTITNTTTGIGTIPTINVEGIVTPPPPANDDCINATNLTIGAAPIVGDLSTASPTASLAQQQTKNDVWYSFTPSCTAELDITTTFTTGPDIDLYVYSSNCPASGNALFSSTTGNNTAETLTQTFTAGTTYYIRVLDFDTNATTFNISVNADGPNNATALEACIADTSIELSWNASTGTPPSGYIVFAQLGATVPSSATPGNASSYTANSDYSSATTYGTLGRAVYKGNATTATITGLTNTSDYSFTVVAYTCETGTGWATAINNTGSWSNTYTIDVPEATITSASVAPTSSVISWTNPLPTSCYEVLIVANQGSNTSFIPTGNGAGYTANATYSGSDSIIFKGNGITTTVTGLTTGLSYCYTIFIRNISTNEWSTGVSTCQTTGVSYCNSNGNTAFSTGIESVSFSSMNNLNTSTNTDYVDYTGNPALYIPLTLGESNNLNVSITVDGNNTVFTKAWIDWNNNGSFNDSGEEYDLGTFSTANSTGATSASPLSINTPAGATLGNTRMRVSTKWGSYSASCETGFSGEVEDYTVVITRPVGPEIHVKGNNNTIISGSNTTTGINNTAFGNSNVGVADTPNTFIIESIGTADLDLTGAPFVEISGANASDFVVTTQPSNDPITSGSSESFIITFTPSEAGPRTATVTIRNNDMTDSEDVFTFVINGTGNGPEINVTGNSLSIPSGSGIPDLSVNNFTILGSSNISTAQLVTKTFTIQNIGNQTLSVSNIVLSGPDATDFTITSPTNLSIPGGSDASLQIEFLPTTIGNKDAIVTITHNDTTGSESPDYTFSIRGIGIDYVICDSNVVQTIAMQDFEDAPATPTWNYTNTQTHASTVSVTGGTGYGAAGDIGGSNLFLDGKSFQLNNTVNTTWAYASLNFDSVDTQGYQDIELSIRVGAFSTSSGTSGLDSDDVIVAISEDNGSTWSDEVRVAGNNNSRWSFSSGTGIASVVYDNDNTYTDFTPSTSGFQTTEGYSTIKVTGLPSVSNLMVRITLKNNRFDEVWSIDDVLLTGKTPSVKTWDGSDWRDTNNTITTPPTSSQKAIFAGSYNTATNGGSVETCECEINASAILTIADNQYVEVQNDVTVDGQIIVNPKGSFVQVNDDALVNGLVLSDKTKIAVEKETAPMSNWYEYTYWSSPVVGEKIEDGLADATLNRRFWFNAERYLDDAGESNNNNNLDYNITDDVDDDNNDWTYAPDGTDMISGRGYASTHNQALFNNPMLGSPPHQFKYTFRGAFNNGVIPVAAYRNDTPTAPDNNWNFIGNPYPSAISVKAFFEENLYHNVTNPNGTITGSIYLWSHNSPYSNTNNGNEALNFSVSDYAVINVTGQTTAGDNTPFVIGPGPDFDRYIPSCQGFFVALSDDATTIDAPSNADPNVRTADIIFNNSMRVKDSNSNSVFYRNSNINLENKLWVDLTSDNGVFSQTLIGYVNGATNSFDGMAYDAPRVASAGANSVLYSIIPNNIKKFAIQGKHPNSLTLDEVIPLGFNTSIDIATLYTLSIAQLEGNFLNNNTIYVKDNLINVVHNLSTSDYTFTSETGEFNNRFEIVFRDTTLSVNEDELNTDQLTIIELNDDNVKFAISNNNFSIKSVEIINVLGQAIYKFEGSSNSEIFNLSSLSQSVYVAKIELSNGQIITKRAIKR
ncbi:choice-of-anchor D domain-containing protein [Ichthyenterobacterium magnum]|uniref:Fibronectin type-III domain-containing protein n=1 Tax=Ichthyenterobacterium magnum TaxID=1230530 RepID=A0A420DWK1_9FLAO|nr:choice-of-anchor D domain-containing protein [Ichthyenterobacterium magnum]RKE98608.1 hypothetical protein BXY80_0698 [Ichthyenterobacterium magnum]